MHIDEIFENLLFEGRDAPLYHGTSYSSAIKAIDGNRIDARTSHYDADLGLEYIKNYSHRKMGVSLSRNLTLAFGFGPVVFEINQRKLAQTFKLIPIDFWSLSDNVNNKNYSYRAHPDFNLKNNGGDRYEFEEFCIGAIEPLSRFLTAIRIKDDPLAFSKIDGIETILDNPLLRRRF